MKYAILLLSIAFSIFYTTSLILAPQLGLPGQLNYSPVSVEEIEALEWIRANCDDFTWNDVICDYFCQEYAAVVFFDLEAHQKYDWNTAVVTDSKFWDEHLLISKMTVLGEDVPDEGFKFAVYSPRQANKGIFRLWSTDRTRRHYQAFPMMDVWKNNLDWLKVYEEEGVIVYERK